MIDKGTTKVLIARSVNSEYRFYWTEKHIALTSVVVLSTSYSAGARLLGTAGSNSAECMNIHLMCSLCVLQIADSETNLSFVQNSHTECVHVVICDPEPSRKMRPRPDLVRYDPDKTYSSLLKPT
jgi:hypothetical protein